MNYLTFLVVFPLYYLSVIFSLAYPIIRFCLVPWEEQTLLQQMFSVIYISLVTLWLMLLPNTVRWNKVDGYFRSHRTAYNLSKIDQSQLMAHLDEVHLYYGC